MSNPHKKFTRNGKVAEVATLTFHGWFGNLIDRIKAKTTEKDKGMQMVDLIEKRFSLNLGDMEIWRKDNLENERKELEELQSKPFQRDQFGNIISPFVNKKKPF